MERLSLERLPDWEDRLNDLVARYHDRPFAWGRNDCLLWAARCVRAVTGHDPAHGHRGKWKSQASAYRYLKTLGFTSGEGMADAMLERIPSAWAGRGDLVLHAAAIGVCMGGFALFVGIEGERGGLIRVAMTRCEAGWRVG